MHSKKAVVATVAGLAAAAALLTAGVAVAVGKQPKPPEAPSNAVVVAGRATNPSTAKAPQVGQVAAPQGSSAHRPAAHTR